MNASDNAANAATAGLVGGMMLFIVILACALTVFFVWCFWRVFTKAGMNGALGLLCLVPSVGPLVCLLILAFSRWPIEDAMVAYGGSLPSAAPSAPEPPASPPGTSVMPT